MNVVATSEGTQLKARSKAQKKPPISPDEKLRMRARKIVGHDFAIRKDEFKRDRLAVTADNHRQYDIGGLKNVVRVRNVDPLQGMSSLTYQQREAGKRYREDFETCEGEGLKTGSWAMRVDGGGGDRDRPERIAKAHASLALANTALGYDEIRLTVISVCGLGLSVKALSDRDRNPRDAVTKMLSMGLQRLAEHYGIVPPPKRS